MFEDVAEKLARSKIVPVVTVENSQDALEVAGALLRGGMLAVEIAFRTLNGDDGIARICGCIKKVREEVPGILVGAGTVTDVALAQKALDAGAQFIVSPGFDEETVDFCVERNLPVFPGVSTPSEVQAACRKNLSCLKYFPSEAAGGVEYIKNLSGPFPGVKFMATGGINAQNARVYLSCGNVFAVGGSWMTGAGLIRGKDWQQIERLSRDALESLEVRSDGASCGQQDKAVPALYLVPVPLSPLDSLTKDDVQKALPDYNTRIVRQIKYFVVENVRSARRFLRAVDKSIDIDALTFYELNEHTESKSVARFLEPLEKRGEPVGIISEAGCPAVADPGADLVRLAHSRNLPVVPLVGPSSILMALMASGFNGQNFSFCGYLPIKDSERASALRKLEGRAWSEGQTQIFIEAPYRNQKMFDTIIRTCRKETGLCIALGLTCGNEQVRTMSVAEWRKCGAPEFSKIPAIFLIYRD